MNFKSRFKKYGFSLMEILIAIFIVAILALATMPVINKQISKTDEYSYFLAYNTVEKMAGQIVALGDPEDDTAYLLPESSLIANSKKSSFQDKLAKIDVKKPVSALFSSLASKFTNTQAFILSRFMPRTVAAGVTYTQATKDWDSWYSDGYDELWMGYQICKNNRQGVFVKDVQIREEVNEITGAVTQVTDYIHFDKSDFNCCYGYTVSGKKQNSMSTCSNDEDKDVDYTTNEVVTDFFSGQYSIICNITASRAQSFANTIANQNKTGTTPNAKAFCEGVFKDACSGSRTVDGIQHTARVQYKSDDADDEEDEEEEEDNTDYYSEIPGSCSVESDYTHVSYGEDENQFQVARPSFSKSWCKDNGYKNMFNFGYDADPSTIDCQCITRSKYLDFVPTTDYVVSVNNEKACVKKCTNSDALPYDVTTNTTGLCCTTDFNAKANKCCPEKSLYNPTSEKCECVSGYKMNGAGTKCELHDCPAGSHKTNDGVCVVNPPITSGKRFCEEIEKHWNVASTSCNAFTKSGDFAVNKAVYEAALGKDRTTYLSVNSQIGAFKNIAPNIELSNGMRVWILGDKAASIPGLSYFGSAVSSTQNMCIKKQMTEHTAIACYNADGYFCKSENTCLILDPGSKTAIRDARTCCAAPEMSDLEEAAKVAGKDWKEDPSAYAISGFTVFVDINADKGEGTLWEDVFPFYITTDGVVYPAYPLDAPKSKTTEHDLLYNGGNSDKLLPVDVYYYVSSENSRQRKVAFSGVSYARGICSARKISRFTPYCLNLGEKFNGGSGITSNCPTENGCTSPHDLTGTGYLSEDTKASRNPCDHYNCFVAVRRKLRNF